MPKMKKIRIGLGLLILILSLAFLMWGYLPAGRDRRIQPIAPTELTLPTPASFTPTPRLLPFPLA